ncbi:22201_t:CDS:1, partial [Gigaspora margarita]
AVQSPKKPYEAVQACKKPSKNRTKSYQNREAIVKDCGRKEEKGKRFET